MQSRARILSEEGFTLIELVVVILIIAILSAIAVPAFLGQRAKGQDASAKSDARSMVSAMEACYTEVEKYDPCPDGDPGIAAGTNPGETEVTSSGDEYAIVAHSQNGNTFTIVKGLDSVVTRSCDTSGGTPRGGCKGGTW